jgi:abscisic acid receptor PYR/PYL family
MQNYASIISLHQDEIDGKQGTTVVESFVVDVPDGNTVDETCCFVEHLIKSNLRSLAVVSEQLAHQQQQ